MLQAKSFHGELQDMLLRLGEIDANLATAQPIGGLPESTRKQRDEFAVCQRFQGIFQKALNLISRQNSFLKLNENFKGMISVDFVDVLIYWYGI